MTPRKSLAAALTAGAMTISALASAEQASAPPKVDDPMLAPPALPPRAITSWDEALSLIRAQSPDYRSSEQAVARARSQREIALAAVLPTLNAQGSYGHQILSPLTVSLGPAEIVTPPRNVFTVGGTLSWAVVNPRGIYGIGTADANIDVARLSFEDRRRAIASAAVDALLATLAAERVADLNRVGLRAGLERLSLTETRLQYGQGTELDVDRAQQDVAAARASLISGDESLRRAREAFGVALGSSVPMTFSHDADIASLEASVARSCKLNDDLERRPDIAAARTRVRVAERTVHDAELLFAPSLGVSSTLESNSQPILAPHTTWSVGALLTVPIYDGARYGQLKDARAALEQARQALVDARLQAVVASAQAHRAVDVATQSRDVARAQRELAARVDTRTRDGYVKGLGTSLDLVTSAQALRAADIQLAILDFQVADAQANSVLVNAECVF